MNFLRLLVVAACALTLAGCGQSGPAPGTFDVTVRPVLDTDDNFVAIVDVRTAEPAAVAITSPGSRWWSAKAPEKGIVLHAERIDLPGDKEVAIRASFLGGYTLRYLPKDTRLKDVSELLLKSGNYPLGQPIELGRLSGRTVMLGVGYPAAGTPDTPAPPVP